MVILFSFNKLDSTELFFKYSSHLFFGLSVLFLLVSVFNLTF